MKHKTFVSVHGGHSGQFCNHAVDTLEDIIQQYIALGFEWVGITEHGPVETPELLYPDELEAGMTPQSRLDYFADYMRECRRLQEKYRTRITIFSGMETETYAGYATSIPRLIAQYKPDYIVGSVHHVDDLGFDYSKDQYQETAERLGGMDAMYCRYFDQQHEVITQLEPAVVGHLDVIRIYDPDYMERLAKPDIWQRVLRNLEAVRSLDLILDLNLRALKKGAKEPYVCLPILKEALKMGIRVMPGDDSHGVDQVGNYIEKGIELLERLGFSTQWRQPKLYRFDAVTGENRSA